MSKYRLPASHDLFQTQTLAELHLEQLEDLWDERRDLERQIEQGGNLHGVHERLAQIRRALGDEMPMDDLVEHWEREIAAGRVPDLDLTIDDVRAR